MPPQPTPTTPPRERARRNRSAPPCRPTLLPGEAQVATGGQAAVELVALLPLIVLVLALAYQALLAGQAAWEAHVAARAAARAHAVGDDAARAARAHLPAGLERGLRVHATPAGDVRVSVRIPRIVPAVSLGRVAATAHFRPQDA